MITRIMKDICNGYIENKSFVPSPPPQKKKKKKKKKILWKRGEIAPLFHNIFHLLLDFNL